MKSDNVVTVLLHKTNIQEKLCSLALLQHVYVFL